MAEWLFELYSEEIPAGMQAGACRDLARLIQEGLKAANLSCGEVRTEATPRRLAAMVQGLSPVSPDWQEERKGPRTSAPEKALQGFLQSVGLASTDDLTKVEDAKKGDFYLAVIQHKGKPAKDLLSELQHKIILNFPWPKSMRWGSGTLRWVRPLRSVLSLLENGGQAEIVPLELEGLSAGRMSYGHPRLHPEAFEVKAIGDFETELADRKVILKAEDRKASIAETGKALACSAGLSVNEDIGLLSEVAGLVEYPTLLLGRFDDRLLALPAEVIRASIRQHQKCFVLNDQASGKLSNAFLITANVPTKDGGKTVIAGNERVIRARLADAEFFWRQDQAAGLDALLPKLENVLFHAKLGSVQDRTARLAATAAMIAQQSKLSGAEMDDLARAAQLCKADLVSGMVGEFPELQGTMGAFYAKNQGEKASVAEAIADHYRPQGPSDRLPSGGAAVHLALAEKVELLAAFWSIGEKPTGSRDPYALRRAALGVLRLIESNALSINLQDLFTEALGLFPNARDQIVEITEDLLSFMHDRLRVEARERGLRHDLIEAVLAAGTGRADLVTLLKRMQSLSALAAGEQASGALQAIKRAINILHAEENKSKTSIPALTSPEDLAENAEKALWQAAAGDFALSQESLDRLERPINMFFDELIVNDDNPDVRQRRLGLLSLVRSKLLPLANFALLEI